MKVWQRLYMKEAVMNISYSKEPTMESTRSLLLGLFKRIINTSRSGKTNSMKFKSLIPKERKYLEQVRDLVRTAFSVRFPGHALWLEEQEPSNVGLPQKSQQQLRTVPNPSRENIQEYISEKVIKFLSFIIFIGGQTS